MHEPQIYEKKKQLPHSFQKKILFYKIKNRPKNLVHQDFFTTTKFKQYI